MTIPLSASEVLDREFLHMRAKLLEVASSFDRMTRADGNTDGDLRIERLRAAMQIILDLSDDRAEQLQLLFSHEYDDQWQEVFGM
jgi:hypothetical protein